MCSVAASVMRKYCWKRRCAYWALAVSLYLTCRSLIMVNTFVDHENDVHAFGYKKYVVEHLQHPQERNGSGPLKDNINSPSNRTGHNNLYPELVRIVLASSQACPGIVRSVQVSYVNEHWQTEKADSSVVHLYSAFLDNRLIVGRFPVIRILAVTLNKPKKLFCQVWYDDFSMPYLVKVDEITTGRGDVFRNTTRYYQLLYSCTIKLAFPIPSHVSIVTTPCRNSSTYLPITVGRRETYENKFGICVAISFGQLPTSDFVEWMELHRMFGVAEFNIYNGSISADMYNVFKYYTDMGVLRLFHMSTPVNDFSKKGVKLSSPASLNDCMMRNWYRYQYIVVIDFDEFIIPRKHDGYASMLTTVNEIHNISSPWRSYTFRNVYHFDHMPMDNSQPGYLKTMRHRSRVEPSKFLYAAKSFIDPRTCLSVFNHYCYRRFTKYRSPVTIDVKTSIATSHHYRSCGFGTEKCKALSKNTTVDDDVLRFKPELDIRVRNILQEINAL